MSSFLLSRCAIATYSNQAYYNYRYCTESDWTTSSDSDSSDSSDSDGDNSDSSASGSSDSVYAVTGELCVPMTYRLELFLSYQHGNDKP